MRLGKQVTPRAAGRLREVLSAIRVTAQADVVIGGFDRPMTGVATATRGMLRLLVQPAQLGADVAGRAGGRSGHPRRSVRAVTVAAARADFAVAGLRLGGMTLRARSGGARAGMRIMAALARLMTRRRRRERLLVARAARSDLLAVVRVVAADAFGMRGHDASHLRRVARATLGDRQERPVRQSRVAILTVLVPRQARHFRQLFAVTIEARAVIGSLAHEIVRRVAALAVDPSMQVGILGGRLVAATARPRACVSLRTRRMRIVTADAGGSGSGPGMVGVNLTVTFSARLLGSTAHIVRCMAARALPMPGRVSAAQHREVLVARAAGGRLVFGELVRAMTTDALPMPGLEQRRWGHERRLLRVTRHTRLERFRGHGVLLLVTRGASLNDRFTRRGMRRRHVLVAFGARGRDRFGVLVRAVAVEALFGVVNLHGRRRALLNQVTMRAVACGVGMGVERPDAR